MDAPAKNPMSRSSVPCFIDSNGYNLEARVRDDAIHLLKEIATARHDQSLCQRAR